MRFFLIAVSRALNLLPTSFAGRLGGWLGDLWFLVIRFRRGIVESNLHLALGREVPSKDLNRMARANFRHYGKLLLEIGRSIAWSQNDYLRNVTLEGLEHVAPLLHTGTGAFWLAPHLGNWELAIAAATAAGMPIDLVVKHSRTPSGEAFLQWYRRKTGAGVFLEEGTAKDILRAISRGRFVVFVFDQFMGPPIGLPVSFFGQRAGTVASLALLTEKKNIPIVPVYSYRDERGRIRGVVNAPLELPAFSQDKNERLFQKTQYFNDVIEKMVRRYPEQWLWLHRRWKEYRGTPRWLVNPAVTLFVGALLMSAAACTTIGETPTGIPLPSDPKIAVPQFQAQPTGDTDTPVPPSGVTIVPDGAAPTATVTPTPTPTPAPSPEPKARKRKKAPIPKPTPKADVRPVSDYYSVVPSDKVPFEVGEKLEIDLTWMAIPAGRITIEVKDGPAFEGRPTFHLWGNLLSSKVADAIYHVDNTIESFIDKEGFVPYKFLLHMVESVQKKETRVSFDHTKHKAYYWAQRISKKWGDQKEDRVDTYRMHSRDMFSAVYFARTLSFALKQKQIFPIYENNQNIDVELLPVANELVRTKAGVFQCWKILCTARINNVLRPTGDVYMWLSDDSKKYLVKFDAKLKIGSLYGTLASVREHK